MGLKGQVDDGRYQDSMWLATLLDRLVAPWVDPAKTIVVSGFWRSGTTWLQESLAALIGAKTVFEPFHWRVPAYIEAVTTDGHLPRQDVPYLKAYLPYLGHPRIERELWRFIEEVLRANVGDGSWIRRTRSSTYESLRSRVVVKMVRGQLCLPAIQNRFGTPIVHICRDPRAIIASIQRNDWGWWLADLSLREQLLEPTDGRFDFFERWRDLILHYDKQDVVTRIVAYWALLELFAREHGGSDRLLLVSYERLCRDTEGVLARLLRQMGLTVSSDSIAVLQTASETTTRERAGLSVETRINGWKQELDKTEAALIDSVMKAFGLDEYLNGSESLEGFVTGGNVANR